MSYTKDRKWSDKYIPMIKRIVGEYILSEAPAEVDQEEATDLIVFDAKGLKIACRLRRPGYFQKYGDEFTIRCYRESGAKTELEKVINGFGDWFFYGHADGDDTLNITKWMLIDFNSFRAHLIRDLRYDDKKDRKIRHGNRDNGDGTWFTWFNIYDFKGSPPILIASSFVDMGKSL
jgi:hypothetical protein